MTKITLFPKDKSQPKGKIIEEMKDFAKTFSDNFTIFDYDKTNPTNKESLRLEIKDHISREVLDNCYHWNLQQYK